MGALRVLQGSIAALEDAFADAVVGARRGDPLAPLTVVVGQTLLKRYLPRMLAKRGIAHMNVLFLLPDELAVRLAPLPRASGRLTPGAERLLVRTVAEEAAGETYFGEIRTGEGFTQALQLLIRELERGGFSGETFRRTLANARMDREKYIALAELFARYERARTRAGFEGTSNCYLQADATLLDGALLIYGLWNPAYAQVSLLEQIAVEHDVSVFLPTSGTDADGAHVGFLERLKARGAFFTDLEPAGEGVGARLAEEVFRRTRTGLSAPGVNLTSAPDTVQEVWAAARRCLLWAGEGIAFHEIALVYRNREPYRNLVTEVFREAGIPVYVHDGNPVSRHPLGRRLIALLELLADATFSRQRVMDFLTETELPKLAREKLNRFRPSEWERYTREAGVIGGIDQWRIRLQRLAAEKRERADREERFEWLGREADRVEEVVAFVERLHDVVSKKPERASWEEHLTFVGKAAAQYADGLTTILEALRDLQMLAAIKTEVTFDQFLAAVRDDLDSRDTTAVLGEPVREFGRQGVAVIDASSLRHLRFRAVYMVGMAERAWPPPKRPDALLLEHERVQLNKAGSSTGIALRTSPDDDALTFLVGLQAATECLVVSYARTEAGGGGRRLPSYFFRAVAQAIEGRDIELQEIEGLDCVQRLAAGRLAHSPIADSLTAAEYDRGLVRGAIYDGQAGVVDALARFDGNDALRAAGAIKRAVAARRARWSRELTAFDGVMVSEPAVARAASLGFGKQQAVSPSRLETYAECPYRYFMRYGLGIEPLDEPEMTERIDALERGGMIHDVLEQFLRELGRDDLPSPERREQHLTRLLNIARQAGSDREQRGVTGRPLIWELDRRKINEDLVRWYDEEISSGDYEQVRPGAFEAAFGGVRHGLQDVDPISSTDPLVLTISGRKIRLQGRIDRVDYDDARTRFRVIDYKTGKSSSKTAFDKGTAMQLPVYLLAAAKLLEMAPEVGEAQYYYCTSKGNFKRSAIAGSELAERQQEFEQVLTTIADGAESGYFAPHPGKAAFNCNYCDYTAVCDSRIERLAGLKEGDARGAAFVAMQDIK